MTEQEGKPPEGQQDREASPPYEIEEPVQETSPGAPVRQHGPARRRRLQKILLVAAVITVTAGIGAYLGRNQICKIWMGKAAGANNKSANSETYYCPMHTDYKSDKPGNCPICSMKLVKLEKPQAGAEGTLAASSQSMPGMPGMETTSGDGNQPAPDGDAVFIDPQRQQLIGVHSEPAVVKPLVKEIRAVGKVAYDESKLTHIHSKVTGYVDEVFVDYVGKAVKKGDPLFTIYSPDLVSTEEEYLLALRAGRAFSETSFAGVAARTNSLVEAARRRLELWDVTPAEIKAIEKEGKARRTVTMYSPVNGIVMDRAAYHHGKYVTPEQDLYTIVDLSDVWVVGEVYESELPFVKVGQTVEVEFPYNSTKKTLRGKISFVYPYLEDKTRTGKIRIQFPNPGLEIKPDMFVNVKLKINLGNKLVVPDDALLDTGTQQYVFVDKGGGYFEPRAVKVGPEAEGFYPIEAGLKAGERVVTAANFILDSESRLKGAFANMGTPGQEHGGTSAAAPASQLKIEVIEPRSAKVGQNAIRVDIKDASGNPVTDAEVEVTLFMPQMGSMAPMTSKATLNAAGNGQYAGTIDIPMAWSWQTTISVKKGGQPLGSTQKTITAH